jgi:hypothetical protein
MRGSEGVAGSLFSYVDLEKRMRADHPLRVIRGVVNATLAAMSSEFDALYAPDGRASIRYSVATATRTTVPAD